MDGLYSLSITTKPKYFKLPAFYLHSPLQQKTTFLRYTFKWPVLTKQLENPPVGRPQGSSCYQICSGNWMSEEASSFPARNCCFKRNQEVAEVYEVVDEEASISEAREGNFSGFQDRSEVPE
ncbi:hypothetical protein RDI58_022493 [Solanum bulbocastanum]|uniref:Uncharacterized protein n=1 Tax=Solanum bulbocastanum TaxID=147425 RepID=A0AAN8Y5P6_SOLBU